MRDDEQASHASARTTRILVVEDNADMGAILASTLEDQGFQVYRARSGAEALEMARQLGPDLITLDLGLPGVSGVEVAAALRADPATQAIPIVAVSAHADEPEIRAHVAVDRLIAKPFYLSEVLDTVLEMLGLPPSTQ